MDSNGQIQKLWYSSSSPLECLLELDFKYAKELRKLHNDFPLASHKIKIKRKFLIKVLN